VELMERAHAISPQFVEAARWLGQLYIENGQLEKAEEYYVNIVQVYPGDAEVRYRLGRIHMELGRPDEAIRDLQYAIELDRSYRDAYLALADTYTRLGMVPERDAVLRSWLQVEPSDAGVRAFLEKYGGSQ